MYYVQAKKITAPQKPGPHTFSADLVAIQHAVLMNGLAYHHALDLLGAINDNLILIFTSPMRGWQAQDCPSRNQCFNEHERALPADNQS